MDSKSGKGGVRYWTALICAGITTILFLILHTATVILAYQHSSLFASIISFLLPPFSELFWGYQIWAYSEVFFNLYNTTFIAICVLTALCYKLKPDLFNK